MVMNGKNDSCATSVPNGLTPQTPEELKAPLSPSLLFFLRTDQEVFIYFFKCIYFCRCFLHPRHFFYLFASFSADLLWATCGHYWNTGKLSCNFWMGLTANCSVNMQRCTSLSYHIVTYLFSYLISCLV